MANASGPPPNSEVTRLMDYQRALAGLSRVASELLPQDRLLHHVTAVVSRVTHIRHVKILAYRPDLGDLFLIAGVGWKPGLVGTATFSLDSASPMGRAMQTGNAVVIPDLLNDKDFRVPPSLAEHGIEALANTPIKMDGKVWGLLEVDSSAPRRFDDADMLFLAAASNIIGVALLRHQAQAKMEETEAQRAKDKSFSDIILREYKHRVKNNLQTIISFLSMHRRQAAAPDEAERIGTLMNRVHAIALAQDQLTLRDGSSEVEFDQYLRSLCTNIDPKHERISIEVSVAGGVLLPLDRAVAAGLIVNELVTNAFKYAYGEDGGGIIRVTFKVSPHTGEGVLVVEDDGRGMGPSREGGLGLRLVASLAAQIEGQIAHETVAKGTRTCLRFPVPAGP